MYQWSFNLIWITKNWSVGLLSNLNVQTNMQMNVQKLHTPLTKGDFSLSVLQKALFVLNCLKIGQLVIGDLVMDCGCRSQIRVLYFHYMFVQPVINMTFPGSMVRTFTLIHVVRDKLDPSGTWVRYQIRPIILMLFRCWSGNNLGLLSHWKYGLLWYQTLGHGLNTGSEMPAGLHENKYKKDTNFCVCRI